MVLGPLVKKGSIKKAAPAKAEKVAKVESKPAEPAVEATTEAVAAE